MPGPSYIRLREETGSYTFRWVVPADIRPLIGGRREVTKALGTEDKRLALRLARRLAAMLDRFTYELEVMAKKEKPEAFVGLTIKTLERLVDGSVRIEGLEMDPDPAKAEEERKHLAALLGPGATPATPAADGRTLADLVKAYKEHGERAKLWTEKTSKELDNYLRLMLDVMGETTPLATLSRKHFAEYKDALMRLPRNRSKSPLYREKSVLELLGMNVPEAHRMSVNTINNHLAWTSSATEWAAKHGYIGANYAEGLSLPATKRASEHRDPYTAEEVLKMKAALLAGEHGAGDYPWRKWVPLLLAYQGARTNEMAQLRCVDVADVEGIPTLTITPEAGRAKTSAAKRTIPIHPELIRLGLLDYVAAMRKRGKVRLFPELPEGRDGHGQAVSRWWGRYSEKIGLGHRDLHALRHTWTTALKNADVPQDLIDELGGWARNGSEGARRYAKGSPQSRLLEALSTLRYGDEPGATTLRLVAGG